MDKDTYRFVLLVEVVDVAVEDLDEELNADGGVHAGVCYAEGALEALEDALAVSVELEIITNQLLKGSRASDSNGQLKTS